MLEEMKVDIGRQRARVVFNTRTGTVVMGQGVQIGRAAVSHGNLTVTIGESFNVSQPNAFAGGNTAIVLRQTSILPKSVIQCSSGRKVWS
ncbi:flagellar P-ring protein FlgI [Vibrio astriarenae]|nr:flagellar P-ring protein FlgI [Vibrio sp. C7]